MVICHRSSNIEINCISTFNCKSERGVTGVRKGFSQKNPFFAQNY
jgi:hypothetical protein